MMTVSMDVESVKIKEMNVPVMVSARAMGEAATAVARTTMEARVVKVEVNIVI